MTAWTLTHEREVRRCERLLDTFNEVSRAVQHIETALAFVNVGDFTEAHWEFWWAHMTGEMPRGEAA